MTSIPLHSMPRWRTVAGEQIRAVGLMTRKAGLALIALLVVLLVVVVQASIRERNTEGMQLRSGMLEVAAAPWATIAGIIAALFAIALWRDEEPDRRSYHWMMPVEAPVHTLTKVLAGWMWLLAATAIGLMSIALIGGLSSVITGLAMPPEIFTWSFWFVPITSITIAYVLVSAATVGTRQPLLWLAGVILLYSGSLLALEVLGYRATHDVVRTAFTGEYGISAALAGDIDRLDTAQLRMTPSIARWLGATALWGGLGALLLVATSYRRAEPAVVGDHGPFRRAISGHAWLVATVIAISVAAGLVATRVMKPQYEARAMIWSNPRVVGEPAVSIPEQRLTKARDQVELLTSWRIADTVVQRLALYVRPENAADTSLLRNFALAQRFIPGNYSFALADGGTRWQLTIEDIFISESGVVGDSIGWTMGLRWRPEAATLARYAGREVGFTVATPREAAAELLTRTTILAPPNSSFLRLAIEDPDPHRAARTLNAIAYAYVAKTGAATSVLDSAVAPLAPFKNSPAQLFAVSLVIGIAAAVGLAFAASALERRFS